MICLPALALPLGETQQIDIMPTVLDYLGYDEPYLAFGFNLNRIKDNFAFNYFNGIYQLITDQYLLIFDGEKSTGLYELHTDKLLTVNLVSTRTKIVEELECKAKAFLQQYTTRMIDNRLVVR
jgi:arylsulfatase A-like enzyme